MQHPDYVVLRPSLDLPEEWMPRDLDGRWYDRNHVPRVADPAAGEPHTVAAHPSGRFEVREDGVVAEVWEIRPDFHAAGR